MDCAQAVLRATARPVCKALAAALRRYAIPRQILTDSSEFQTAFHWHLQDRGIRHVYIKPATPRLNGKVERSHRIAAEEFYCQLGVVIDDAELFNDKLAEWQEPSPPWRPQRPDRYERLRQKTSDKTPV